MRTTGLIRCAGMCWVMVLLLWSLMPARTALAEPKPLTREEQARIDRAIDKGVAFLKKSQKKDGSWPRYWPGAHIIGQSALPAYALMESGVPATDPVIQKAAAFLRRIALKTYATYELSLAILFFDRLGDPKDEKLIQRMALRLIVGQSRTGGWSYRNLTMNEKYEAPLLKTLEDLNNRMEAGKSTIAALREVEIPRSFRHLTVFRDPRTFDWQEVGECKPPVGGIPLIGITDNSNTQFAIMGLWVAQRHNIPTRPTFRMAVERFERCQQEDGKWSYNGGYKGIGRSPIIFRSMICSGLLALAVGRGTKLPTPGAPPPGSHDVRILRGLSALSQEIGVPIGVMGKRVPHQDPYFLWSLERVGMLYKMSTIVDKDWYRWGAEVLVANQMKNGSWPGVPGKSQCAVSTDYGHMLNTSFALLFLKRSHPMKDLTPKLIFTARQLNEGIARLRRGETLPTLTTNTLSSRKDQKPKQTNKKN